MKKTAMIFSLAMAAVMLTSFAGCGGKNAAASAAGQNTEVTVSAAEQKTEAVTAARQGTDEIAGTWKQTSEISGNWTWTFDGKGKCTLEGETAGSKSDGTYELDETAKTLAVKIKGWSTEKAYSYTLTETTLDLEAPITSYHLVKQ